VLIVVSERARLLARSSASIRQVLTAPVVLLAAAPGPQP